MFLFVFVCFKHYHATHTAPQTLNKQFDIAVDRADSMLQRRFVGDVKTVSIAFCSSLWVFYFSPRLKRLNMVDKIHGYIQKVNLQTDTSGEYPSLANNVTLGKKVMHAYSQVTIYKLYTVSTL